MPIMLGGKKNGLAYPLKAELNNYSNFIKQPTYPGLLPLALDAKEDPRVTEGAHHTGRRERTSPS